jgi:hypothetical protein
MDLSLRCARDAKCIIASGSEENMSRGDRIGVEVRSNECDKKAATWIAKTRGRLFSSILATSALPRAT